MTAAEFRAALEDLGMRQVDLIRVLGQLSGRPFDKGTVNRWATGRRKVPTLMVANLNLLRLVEDIHARTALGR